MKKVLILSMLLCTMFVLGCSKNTSKSVLSNFEKKVNKANSYTLSGILEIINNEDSYKYDVNVSYKENDMYRVSLKNQANDHEQLILKNEEGVYVLTPSLNKSFKFQSEWPNNNSQTYLLASLLDDITNDNKRTFEEKNGEYIYTSTVNYPNNRKLVNQKVYFNSDNLPTKVEVMDANGIVMVRMNFSSIDINSNIDNKLFTLNENMNTNSNTNTTISNKIDSIVYPVFMPENTYLSSKDVVAKSNGERVILTFSGDNPFILVEETATVEDEFSVIPMYGEPDILIDTVGAISDSSVTWVSNGVEYYLASDVMSSATLLEVAKSLSVLPVSGK